MADPIIGKISVGDGATFTPEINNDVLSWSNDKNLPNPPSLDIVGATFTPAVSNSGVLSWTNNKGLPNPQSVDMAQAVVDKKPGWGIPIGYEYFTFNPNIPQGALPLFGGEYSRTTYSDLWAWVQTQTGYLKTEAEWQTLSTSNNGNVPYYSDGDGSTTFRVPSLKCWVKGANGTVAEVGSYLEAGLPNITGHVGWRKYAADGRPLSYRYTGAFYQGSDIDAPSTTCAEQSTNKSLTTVEFDASRVSSVYGNSSTVQPESIVGMWLVKAYGTVVDTGQIDEQQYIDDRIAALPNTFLPLTGGTMLGAIRYNGANNRSFEFNLTSDANGTNMDVGWNYTNVDGAGLGLRSTEHSTESGAFNLYARNSTSGEKSLIGKPDGSLTWGGNNVATDKTETGTVTAASGTLVYGILRKRGSIVELFFHVQGFSGAANAWTNILNIPAGFRPISTFDFPIVNNITGWGIQAKFEAPAGQIKAWGAGGTISDVKGHVVYFV